MFAPSRAGGRATPSASTLPANTDTSVGFGVIDDDPSSSGSCLEVSLSEYLGTVTGCHPFFGNWVINIRTSGGGHGSLNWTYRDIWGATRRGNIQISVQ